MNEKVILSVVLCFIFKIKAHFIEDYCWRDYDGVIPSDAFKGGIDKDEKPIYIGQVLFDDKLIPGKIHHDTNEIHIEFGTTAFTVNETIKILCTEHPGHFKWVKTETDYVLEVGKKYNLFEGGYEKKVTTYIGRTWSFNELTVGKVICWPAHCIPLSTVEKGQYTYHSKFEILTYDPNGKTEDESSKTSTETPVKKHLKTRETSVSPGWYVFLVIGMAILIAVVVILIRRC